MHAAESDQTTAIRRAVVVDTADTDQYSRVKVRVLPEMEGIQETLLPWANPITTFLGNGANTGAHTPPEQDSNVYVLIMRHWTVFYYIADVYVEGQQVYGEWSTPNDMESQSYPQPRFWLFNDGSVRFINTETGAQGVIHNNGNYALFDKNGALYVYTSGQSYKIYNDNATITVSDKGAVLIENQNGTAEIADDGVMTFENSSGSMELGSTGRVSLNGSNLTVDP